MLCLSELQPHFLNFKKFLVMVLDSDDNHFFNKIRPEIIELWQLKLSYILMIHQVRPSLINFLQFKKS